MVEEQDEQLGLFETTANLIRRLKDAPTERIPIPPFDKEHFGRKIILEDIPHAREDIDMCAKVAYYGGIPQFAKLLPKSEFAVLNKSDFFFTTATHPDAKDSKFILASDSSRALSMLRPQGIATGVLDLRNVLLGGSVGKEWAIQTMQDCEKLKIPFDKEEFGLTFDVNNPLVLKHIGKGYNPNALDVVCAQIRKYYKKQFLCGEYPSSSEVFLLCAQSTLKELQEGERVPSVSIGTQSGRSIQ